MRRAEWPGCTLAPGRGRQIAKGTLLSIQKLIKEPLGRICTQQCADHETKLAARQIVLAMDEKERLQSSGLFDRVSFIKIYAASRAYASLDLSLIYPEEKSRRAREYYTKAVAYDVVVHLTCLFNNRLFSIHIELKRER